MTLNVTSDLDSLITSSLRRERKPSIDSRSIQNIADVLGKESVTNYAETFSENPDLSGLFGVLNESKLLTMFDKAICERYGDKVSPNAFSLYSDYLMEQIALVEQFAISNLKLKGIEVPIDEKNWARNKMRIDWGERLCNAWVRAGEDGVNALKERVPAIVALSLRYGGKINYLSNEPFNSPGVVTLRNGIDNVSAMAMRIGSKLEDSIDQAEIVKMIVINTLYQAEELKKELFQSSGIEPNKEQEQFTFLNALNRVSVLYEKSLERINGINPEMESTEKISSANKEVGAMLKVGAEIREEVLEKTQKQVKALFNARKAGY